MTMADLDDTEREMREMEAQTDRASAARYADEEDEDQDDDDGGKELESAPLPVHLSTVLDVDVDDLLISPRLHDIRQWTESSQHELSIPELAESILEIGQQQRCRVYPTPEGYVLYIGERRYNACAMLKDEGYTWPDGSAWKVKVEVDPDMTEEKALRACLHENLMREDLTFREKAGAIRLVREANGWTDGEDYKNTERVAEFLRINPASVMNYELVADGPAEIGGMVESGQMTFSAAVDLLRAKKDGAPLTEDALKAVVGKAEEAAAKDLGKKGVGGRKGKGQAAPTPANPANPARDTDDIDKADKADNPPAEDEKPLGPKPKDKVKQAAWMTEQRKKHNERIAREKVEKAAAREKAKTDKAAAAKPVVSTTHIRKALQETGAADNVKAPKLVDFLNLFEEFAASPTYPEVMQKAFAYTAKWGHGAGKTSDKGMQAAWDDVADQCKPLVGIAYRASAAETASATSSPSPATPSKPTGGGSGKGKGGKTPPKPGKVAKGKAGKTSGKAKPAGKSSKSAKPAKEAK
jgi:hypothetical protein